MSIEFQVKNKIFIRIFKALIYNLSVPSVVDAWLEAQIIFLLLQVTQFYFSF